MADPVRECLWKMGVEVQEDWVVQEFSVRRETTTEKSDPDVYGNVCDKVAIVGSQVSLVLYRAEN